VIGKVGRGRDVAGLLRYLFGPGRANEHTQPHLVASWDGAHRSLEPPHRRERRGRRDVSRLAGLLSQPVVAGVRPPDKVVWHCSVRAAPGDRRLTDAEWEAVAGQVMSVTGIAPDGDADACRWVAVRHADDHIHIVATLVRQDGRTERAGNDFYRVGEACRWAEAEYRLTRTAPRDRTATRFPSRAEREKSARMGGREPARVALRRQVRAVAAAAATPDEFLQGLVAVGLQVRPRLSERDGVTVTGYAVALPGDHDRQGRPIWFGGRKLAADLSWPRLSVRWPDTSGHVSGHMSGQPTARTIGRLAGARPRLSAIERDLAWRDATRLISDAATNVHRLSGHAPATAAAIARAAGDVLAVTAGAVEGRHGGPLSEAATTFDRAARELARPPVPAPRSAGSAGRGLRAAARLIALTGRARHDETTQVLALVLAIADLAEALAVLRRAQNRPAQADAARTATRQLRGLARAAASTQPAHSTTPRRYPQAPKKVASSTDPTATGPPATRTSRR
jgi:hypothetical protein